MRVHVQSAWLSSYEFACHSASCAPPPVGSGGSSGGSKFLSADQAAVARRTLGVYGREDMMRKRRSDLEHRRVRDAGRDGSLPGTHAGDHRAAYVAMKKREAAQAKLAQTNRTRANYGMPPISASAGQQKNS